jgi:hypothetical protein
MRKEAFTPERPEMKGEKQKGSTTRKYFMSDKYLSGRSALPNFQNPISSLETAK